MARRPGGRFLPRSDMEDSLTNSPSGSGEPARKSSRRAAAGNGTRARRGTSHPQAIHPAGLELPNRNMPAARFAHARKPRSPGPPKPVFPAAGQLESYRPPSLPQTSSLLCVAWTAPGFPPGSKMGAVRPSCLTISRRRQSDSPTLRKGLLIHSGELSSLALPAPFSNYVSTGSPGQPHAAPGVLGKVPNPACAVK